MLQLQNRQRSPGNPGVAPPASDEAAPAGPVRGGGNALPQLGVSWLNNFLQVAVVQQGQMTAEWSSPLSGEDVGDLGDLLREAVRRTGYSGTAASLVFSHPQFIQQLIDAPPAQGAAMDAYLQRLVDEQKGPEGALAWVAQPRLHGKSGQGMLLSLLPDQLLRRLKEEFQRAGLRLKVLVPVSAILQEQLSRIPRSRTETVMVVADTNGLTSLLVARPDGDVILGRSVAGGWSLQADRVAMDIKRTSLFVNQQLGQAVGSIWLFAPPSPEQMRRLQTDLGIPVLPFPLEVMPTFWAEAVTRWPADRAPNLIPYEPEIAPRQSMVNRVVLSLAAGVAVVALGTVVLLEALTRQESDAINGLKSQEGQLQARHLELQRLTGDVVSRRNAIRELKDNRLAPVPAWFLGQLGEACPRNLLLTSAHIRRDGEEWRFSVTGRLQPAARTNLADSSAMTRAAKEFSTRLSNGPLRAQMGAVALSGTPAKPDPGNAAFVRWAQTKGFNPGGQAAEQRFTLEGTLK